MGVTQEHFQQHGEIGGQEVDTQELVVLHLPIKSTAKIQVAVADAHVEIEMQEEVVL